MWLKSIDADLCSTELGILSDLVQKAFMNFAVAVMAATTAVKGGVKLHTSIIRNSAIMKTSILDGRSSGFTQVSFFFSLIRLKFRVGCNALSFNWHKVQGAEGDDASFDSFD